MGVKNINIFEQHVEKIVLGVAAAGAVFMGYLAVQTVKVPETDVDASHVESSIQDELSKLEDAKKRVEGKGKPKIEIPAYDQMYKDLAASRPLAPELLAKAPLFGPANVSPVGRTVSDLVNGNFNLETPNPISAEFVIAEPMQIQVAAAPATAPAGAAGTPPPAAAPMSLDTHDATVVAIEGFIPVGEMIAQMDEPKTQETQIPENRRRAVVARVRVERSEDMGSGAWSKPELVTPPQGAVPVTPVHWEQIKTSEDVRQTMEALEGEFKQTVLPDYGNNVNADGTPVGPPMLGKKIPLSIDKRMKQMEATSGKAKAVPANAAAGAAQPGTDATFPTDILTLKGSGLIPFVVWDEHATPGHRYRYLVTVEMVNPNYNAVEKLQKPELKSVPLLVGQTVPAAKPVSIPSPIQFFVTEYDRSTGGVQIRLFLQVGGHWADGLSVVIPGGVIGGKTKNGPVDTHFILVDTIEPAQRGGPVRVILRDPQGNLVVRDSETDKANPEYDRLKEESLKKPSATSTAPAP